jgi:nicotinate-nucleotide adenylyltransferase
MKNIALFGGAFDPVHNGHIKVVEFVLTNTDMNEVWLLPALKHKYNKEMVDFSKRIEMCRIAAQGNDKIKISPAEILNKDGSVYCLINEIKKVFKDDNFSFVIGLDNALTFNQWYKYEWLEQNVPFIIVPRHGFTVSSKNIWFDGFPHVNLVNIKNDIPDISSTALRRVLGIINRKNIVTQITMNSENTSLNPDVLKYIIDNELYLKTTPVQPVSPEKV